MKSFFGYLLFIATLIACGLAVDAALSSFTIGERAQGGYDGAGISRDASEAVAEAEKAVGRLDAGERNDD
ncbi:hypothetical protein J2T09_002984 [Neorhizobium huautlense]|uniref:Secreted protein n=1 Tax=Neorhizobium huautlense TaxID=67774 RepID=A0ABT9PUR9_9HYPH|nr:hypothetical protein [Neorhizobium huautlense]MDP9838217.1 hypothetical protein [Neorhizobium huautlense]